MPKVTQLDWSKLKPNRSDKKLVKLSPSLRKQKWANKTKAKEYVDLLFVSKVQDSIDNDKDI